MKYIVSLIILLLLPSMANAAREVSTFGSNIGIGTISQSNALSVRNTLAVGSSTYTSTTAPTNGAIIEGNVGVGVTSPAEKLEVSGTTKTTDLKVTSLNPGECVQTTTGGQLSTTGASCGSGGGSGSNYWSLSPGNVGVNTTNNVGIGSISPTSKLDVNGDANISGSITVSGSGNINFNNGTTINASNTSLLGITGGNLGISSIFPGKTLDVAGTARISSDSVILGNLGIGTSAVQTKLSVIGNVGIGTTTASFGRLIVIGGNVGVGTFNPASEFQVGANNFRVAFQNVGIGSLTPESALAVTGTITTDILKTRGSGVATFTSTNANGFGFDSDNNGSNNLTINSSGNVGIGSVAPGKELDVQGTIRTSNFQITTNPSSGYVLISDSVGIGTWMNANTLPISGGSTSPGGGQNAIQYNNSGSFSGSESVFSFNGTNIGIGTTSGQKLLDIRGDMRTTGNVGIGTSLTSAAALSVMSGNVGVGTWVPSSLLFVGTGASGLGVGINNGAISVTNGAATTSSLTLTAASLTTGRNIIATCAGSGFTNACVEISASHASSTAPVIKVSSSGSGAAINVSAGNIGIGTAKPLARLAVVGNIGVGTITNGAYILNSPPNGGMIVENNVGIGTINPGQLLDVQGTVRALAFTGTGSGDSYTSGNLGIGSLTPGQALDVNGRARLVGLGTTVPNPVCIKADGTLGWYTGSWGGTCN